MSEVLAVTDEDTKWLENLSRTGPGRQLDEHLKCVDFCVRNKNRSECPVQQVGSFRRTFMRCYAESDRCFGLPRPTPRFVAVVNMSGYRTIYYSDRTALIRLLCLVGPDNGERVMRNVEQVIRYAVQNECTLLCCLSLPWQSGVHQVHWEVRTVERNPDGSVRDGARCYSYTSEDVRTVATSAETDVGELAIAKEEMCAMLEHFKATNLDVMVEDGDVAVDDSVKMGKLRSLMAVCKADRMKVIGDMNAMQTDHNAKLVEANTIADERVAKVVEKAKVASQVNVSKMDEMQKHITTLTEQNAALEKKNAQLTREKAEQDLMFERERNQLTGKAKVQEMSAKTASDKLAALSRNTERERGQLEKAHAKVVEGLEKRLSDKTMEVRAGDRRVEDQVEGQRRLEIVCDQLRTEKQALQYETIMRRKKAIGMQCAAAVACYKYSALKECAGAGHNEMKQMLATAEGAAHTAELALEQMSKEFDEKKKELTERTAALAAERKKKTPKAPPPAAPAAPKPVMVDSGDQTAPMKSKVDQELESLSERFVKVQENNDELQQQVSELKSQLENAPDPSNVIGSPVGGPTMNGDTHVKHQVYNNVYTHVVVPQGGPNANGWQQEVDLGINPTGDPGVEAVVGQAQLSMRTLVSMARQGYEHKQAADNMWSELQAMKRFVGAAEGNGGWQQPQPFYGGVAGMVPMEQQWVPAQPVYSNGTSKRGARGPR